MNILFVAAECAPFVKVGGLGDVVGALPAALRDAGHDVRVILPHYGAIEDDHFGIEPLHTFEMDWDGGSRTVEIASVQHDGMPHYFITGWPIFAAGDPTIYHGDEGMDVGRFLFLSASALQFTRWLAEKKSYVPDIIHVHDWHTAYIPYLLKRVYDTDSLLGDIPTVFSIHNMRYQGWGVGWHFEQAGIPPVNHPLLEAMDRHDNSLAIGLVYSTMLSTVSPRYAQEITGELGGFGLDGLLHARLSRLAGILNGIDVKRWDPSSSNYLVQPFDIETLDRRVRNKTALQAELGLPLRNDVPLVGAVMRLVEQKGPGIMVPAVRYMLATTDAQFVLLGTGQYEFETAVWEIANDFPEKAAVRLAFDEVLAERIYGAADIFLMPSLFEPCGIGQMIAMRYGAVPVVRSIGGLADTVPAEIGFSFDDFHAEALGWAMNAALNEYWHNPEGWRTRQKRAMRMDVSWGRSASRYTELYDRTINIHQQYRNNPGAGEGDTST